MTKPAVRIFSYLPNPRIFKATIAARLAGVEIELRGDKPTALADWLWDYDAIPLDDDLRERHAASARTARKGFSGTLYKTDAFLAAHPWGTVPAAFGDDGAVGIFESNSIMRAVARLGSDHQLYGNGPLAASRIDGFLDVALVFALTSQRYLLGLRKASFDHAIHADMDEALSHWLDGVERALSSTRFLAGYALSLADICFACELLLLENEHHARTTLADAGLAPLIDAPLAGAFPRAVAHYASLCRDPAFEPDCGPYLERLPARLAP